MKDIIIPSRLARRELIIIIVCFLASFCTNIGAVIAYHKSWTEIFSQIGYVVVIAAVLYALLWVIRLICLLVRRLFCKK